MEALKAKGIEIGSNIRQTKDIWARDYMPIQIDENKFMRYKYTPDYLVKVPGMSKFITDKPDCDFLKDKDIVDCNLVLDGGNVVVCGNKIILKYLKRILICQSMRLPNVLNPLAENR